MVRGGRAVRAVVRAVRAVNNREDRKDCFLVGTSIRRNGFPANRSSYYNENSQDTPSLHILDHFLSSMVRECPSKMIYTMPWLHTFFLVA